MDSKKHNEIITSITENLGDVEKVNELLTQLVEGNKEDEEKITSFSQTVDTLSKDNKSLLRANELFAEMNKEKFVGGDKEKEEENKEEETLKFEDLFNEKGELK